MRGATRARARGGGHRALRGVSPRNPEEGCPLRQGPPPDVVVRSVPDSRAPDYTSGPRRTAADGLLERTGGIPLRAQASPAQSALRGAASEGGRSLPPI